MSSTKFSGTLSFMIALSLGATALAVNWPSVQIGTLLTGGQISRPVYLTHAGDGSGRIFVIEQVGRIRIIQNGVLQPTPFLNITNRVAMSASSGDERGLLGLAFPPGPGPKSYFYVYYFASATSETRLSRFLVTTNNANLADANSEQILLHIAQPQNNHNGGQICFGPDGYLYVGVGDGGAGNDEGTGHALIGNGQTKSTLLGKLLRLDVEKLPLTNSYAYPPGNPSSVDTNFLSEIWAYGLRNPYRFSFDRMTGDMWIADVGQDATEEIDFQVVGAPGGRNYGWRRYEANTCLARTNDPPCGSNTNGMTFPAFTYAHAAGRCSVTGGYVHRGAPVWSFLNGAYIYGDYCTGEIWGLKREGNAIFNRLFSDTTLKISGIGEDEEGNVYVLNLTDGAIRRIDEVLVDADHDKMPDSYEFYYGLNSNNVADATGDADRDGFDNYREFVAGTDPTNAASHALSPVVGFGASNLLSRFSPVATNLDLAGDPGYKADYSGCCYDPATGELLVVLRGPSTNEYAIHAYAPDGTYHRRVTLTGFLDLEAICIFDPASNLFAVVDEGVNEITVLRVTTNTVSASKASGLTFRMGLGDLGNNGIEGLTWDAGRSCFYAVKEWKPMAAYRVAISGSNAVTTTLFNAPAAFTNLSTDLSDVYFDPISDHLLILGDESRIIMECDLAGTIIATAPTALIQGEGIALAPGREEMQLIGEPNQQVRYLATSQTAVEGGTLSIPVSLSALPDPDVTASVDYVVSASTALPGSDFVAATGTLFFTSGNMSARVVVTTLEDLDLEGPEELLVTLTNARQAVLSNDRGAVGRIIDNENTNLVLTAPPQVMEGAGVLTNAGTVTIGGTLASNLTVALASSDTQALTVPANVVIPAGATSATFNIAVVDDAVDYWFRVIRISGSATGLGPASVNVGVDDNDPSNGLLLKISRADPPWSADP